MKTPKKFMQIIYGQRVSKFSKPQSPRPSDTVRETQNNKFSGACADVACASEENITKEPNRK
ncbi:MAG: hypothetical protein ACYDG6_03385 [Thermincolia bacterium]